MTLHSMIENKDNYTDWRSLIVGTIGLLLLCTGLWECGLGWSQLFGFSRSRHPLFPVTGSFYNPGPYCGFIAILIPLALHYMMSGKPVSLLQKVLGIISPVYLVMGVALMPVLMGRTGWIAAAVGSLFVLMAEGRLKRPGWRWGLFWVTLLGIALVGAYMLKPLSALGRLLLWRLGIEAALAAPLTGSGYSRVAGEIGAAQERYFHANPDSPLAGVAGVPEDAFNDYLQIWIAFGLPAMILFVGLLVGALYCSIKSRHYGVGGALVAFAVVCCASYPLRFPEFVTALALLIVASVVSYRRIGGVVVGILAVLLTVLGLFVDACLFRYQRADREWSDMKYYYPAPLSDRGVETLDSVRAELGWSPRFLFDYGKLLRESGLYEKSNTVLTSGSRVSADPMFLNLIGRNFRDLGLYHEAESLYLRSIDRLPGRLYPYYLLGKLYSDSASFDRGRFEWVYDCVLNMELKVKSPATDQMERELSHINDSIKNRYGKTGCPYRR